jgi:ligand-binding sensor domain-containing protein
MTRVVCLVAVVALLLVAQPAAQRGPLIRWQPTTGPLGGEADSILVHAGQLIVPLHNVGAWRSRDRGKSWRLVVIGRPEETWGMTKAGPDLFAFRRQGLHRAADLSAPWGPCGAVPRPPGTYGHLIGAGDTLFYFVMDVGLLRSRDRCATWTPVAVPWKGKVEAVDVVFSRRAMIVNTWRGAFRTSDHGDTWESVTRPPSRPSTSVVDGAAGVLIGTSNGVYRSTDDGLSWTHQGFTGRWVGHMIATPRGEIYAAVDKGSDRPVGTTMMRSVDNGATWTAADEGLSGHPITGLALDESGTLYAAGVTGVYRWEPAGRWQHIGLHTVLGTSLFGAPWGDMYAMTDRGAYRTTDNRVRWRPLLLPDGVGHAVTLTKDGNLLLGTSEWLYRSSDRGETWEQAGLNQPVSALFTVPSTGVILAGTSDGLFRSTDNGKTWIERSVGLRSFEVTSFGASADGAIFAGTVAGEGQGEVYRSTDNGDHWRLLAPESLQGAVNALAVLPSGRVMAGTGQGIFRWAADRRDWEQLFGRSGRTRVSSLVLDGKGRVIAGTTNAGVFVSEDGGDTWIAANVGLATLQIRALAVAADGDVYAAAGPADWEAYAATGRTTNVGLRGIFKGHFASPGR